MGDEARLPDGVEDRFWAKVDRSGGPDECWEWLGTKNDGGYGLIGWNKRSYYTHRFVLGILGGRQAVQVVRHLCNNRACVNPRHLAPGTQRENLADMKSAGRSLSGEKNHQCRLSEADVVDIRRRFDGSRGAQNALAREFGVSKTQIARILRGNSWGHLEDAS